MDIKSNSLLFKFLEFNGSTYDLRKGRVTLCELFWLTVWYVVKSLLLASTALLILCMPGPVVISFLGLIPTATGFLAAGTHYAWWIYAVAAVCGPLFWASVVLALTLVIWPLSKLGKWISYKRDETKFVRAIKKELAKDEELRFGNIWQKLKIAKEEKLCPIIRVVDPD